VKKNPSMHTNTNFLLVNLAAADMLATVLSIFHVVDYLAIDLHFGMYSMIIGVNLDVSYGLVQNMYKSFIHAIITA
jgi:hypothetical protein